MKVCKKCHKEKDDSEFYKNDRTCKECRKSMVRKNRASKVDYYREYDKKRYKEDPRVKQRIIRYSKTEAGKATAAKARLKYIENNTIKRAAHIILGNAVRDGKICKPSVCECCGESFSSRKIQAHHDDYEKPLEVRWLCIKCHTKWHKEHGEGLNGH